MSENLINSSFFDRAEKLIEIKRFREAIPFLTRAYTQNPQNYQVICTLSHYFYELQEDEKSLEYAEEAITVDPEEEWAYRLKTIIYFRQRKFNNALEYAEKAINFDPFGEPALGNLVYAYLYHEQVEEACEAAEQLLESYPDSATSYYIFGPVKMKSFNYAETQGYFCQALALKPNFAAPAAIFLIFLFVVTPTTNFWFYALLQFSFIVNFFWMFYGHFHYTSPK